LCDCVCLVDQQHPGDTWLTGGHWDLRLDDTKRLRDQFGHLPNCAAATSRKAEAEEKNLDPVLAGDGVSEGLGELRLASADIASEEKKWASLRKGIDSGDRGTVLALAPLRKGATVDQKKTLLDQPVLETVETYELFVAPSCLVVREGIDSVEEPRA